MKTTPTPIKWKSFKRRRKIWFVVGFLAVQLLIGSGSLTIARALLYGFAPNRLTLCTIHFTELVSNNRGQTRKAYYGGFMGVGWRPQLDQLGISLLHFFEGRDTAPTFMFESRPAVNQLELDQHHGANTLDIGKLWIDRWGVTIRTTHESRISQASTWPAMLIVWLHPIVNILMLGSVCVGSALLFQLCRVSRRRLLNKIRGVTCHGCGYDLRGITANVGRCPECGAENEGLKTSGLN